MFQTEKHLRQWLMKHIPGHWQPVELSQGVGVPDLNYCVDGREGWAELKVLSLPKTPTAKTVVNVELRPAQYAWLAKRKVAEGNVCVIIGVQDGSMLIVHGLGCMRTMLGPMFWYDLLYSEERGLIPATMEFVDEIMGAL